MTAGTVAIRAITPQFALLHELPADAEFAVVAYTAHGVDVLDTDLGLDHLLAEAEVLAYLHHARLSPPDATCRRCSRPVPITAVYCARQEGRGRDCEAEDTAGEPRQWSVLDVKPGLRPLPLTFVTATADLLEVAL